MFTVTDSVLLRNNLFIDLVMYQLLSNVNEADMIPSYSNIILKHYTRWENILAKKCHSCADGCLVIFRFSYDKIINILLVSYVQVYN